MLQTFNRFFTGKKTNKKVLIITKSPHDYESIQSIVKFKNRHNIDFDLESKQTGFIYRGVSVEHMLGSLCIPGLGIAAMRLGLARHMKAKGYKSLDEICPEEKEELANTHVHGFSLTKGNLKDKANSFTYCPHVAFSFALSAANKTIFPGMTLIGAINKKYVGDCWDIVYDEYDPISGQERGTSIFSYQHETMVPFSLLPIQHYFITKHESPTCLHADEFTQGKIIEVPSSHSQHFTNALECQALEIQKVLAYYDFATMAFTDNAKKDQVMQLFKIYNEIRLEQTRLLNLQHGEKDAWIKIANEIVPYSYNSIIQADEKGFIIEIPSTTGEVIEKRISNAQALILFSPLFEKAPTLTLDQIKNGDIPVALDYMVESFVRNNAEIIKLSVLEENISSKSSIKNSFA